MRLRVFLVWSGPLADQIANELASVLGICCPDAELFYSSTQKAGVFWPCDVRTNLQAASLGIVLMSKQGSQRPNWPVFEMGALQKGSDHDVRTYLLDIPPMHVSAYLHGPLTHFQWVVLDPSEVERMVLDINAMLQRAGQGAPRSLVEVALQATPVQQHIAKIVGLLAAAIAAPQGASAPPTAGPSPQSQAVKATWQALQPSMINNALAQGDNRALALINQHDVAVQNLP